MAAVSGGADSVALLLALRELRDQELLILSAAHVDHGLRPDSLEDAAFVKGLCERWHIPCTVDHLALEKAGENEARNARYDALLMRCREAGVQALALAHHCQDQAETLLLHLFRGSGSAGMAGMEEWALRLAAGAEMHLWRPLLHADPLLLRRVLEKEKISWREDSTNAEEKYLRNYLRHTVLPAVRERIPEADSAMSRAAKIFRDEEDFLQQEAKKWLEQNACIKPPCRFVLTKPFEHMHPALKRHVIRIACPVSLEYAKTEALLALQKGDTLNLAKGWRALRGEKRLHFLSPELEKLTLGTLEEMPYGGKTGDGIRTQAFPKAALQGCQLRTRRPGDSIYPLGAKGEKSLQDYLVDKKIDRPFRDHLPLLCQGSRVIWAIGVGPGEEARVRPQETDAVLLRYEGILPGEMPGNEE